MLIRLTQEHIDKGSIRNCMKCPIALAIFEATGKCTKVYPTICFIGHESYRLPEAAKDFIAKIDSHIPVKPFEFELALDSPIK